MKILTPKNLLRLNRHSGSTYDSGDSLLNFVTESLVNCKPSKPRF